MISSVYHTTSIFHVEYHKPMFIEINTYLMMTFSVWVNVACISMDKVIIIVLKRQENEFTSILFSLFLYISRAVYSLHGYTPSQLNQCKERNGTVAGLVFCFVVLVFVSFALTKAKPSNMCRHIHTSAFFSFNVSLSHTLALRFNYFINSSKDDKKWKEEYQNNGNTKRIQNRLI